MQNEEKNRLEERILAYFDGALDQQSSKQLLAEVAKSGEKRMLFQSHETLSRIISAARVPLETPMEARQNIVDRIPGLLTFIPGLLGTIPTLPVLTQSVNPFIAFFAKIPLSTAISVGTSVAVLTTAGIAVKNKLDDNAERELKAKTAVVQSHTSAAPESYMGLSRTNVGSLPLRNLTTPDLGSANASINIASEAGISSFADLKPVPGLRSSTPMTSVNKVPRNNIYRGTPVSDAISIASSSEIIPKVKESQESIATATPAKSVNEGPAISAVSPVSLPSQSANIARTNLVTLQPQPMNLAEGYIVRPFASAGSRLINLPSVNNNPTGTYHIKTGLQPVSDLRFGLDLLMSEQYSIHIQTGQSAFAQVRTHSDVKSGLISSYIYYSMIDLVPSLWSTVGMTYLLNPEAPFRIILSADVGGAWQLNGIAPMGELGVATEIDVSSRLTVHPAITFDVARVGFGSDQSSSTSTSAIIGHNELAPMSIWNNSAGFSLGIMLRY